MAVIDLCIWPYELCSFLFKLNMPFILIFSRPLERILGRIKFLLSYVYMSVFASIIYNNSFLF
jgi:membrane associated rhomboid family serine protease